MSYLPSFELTGEILCALEAGTLSINCGQWVTRNGFKGRFISVVGKRVLFCWYTEAFTFKSFNKKFKRYCIDYSLKSVFATPKLVMGGGFVDLRVGFSVYRKRIILKDGVPESLHQIKSQIRYQHYPGFFHSSLYLAPVISSVSYLRVNDAVASFRE